MSTQLAVLLKTIARLGDLGSLQVDEKGKSRSEHLTESKEHQSIHQDTFSQGEPRLGLVDRKEFQEEAFLSGRIDVHVSFGCDTADGTVRNAIVPHQHVWCGQDHELVPQFSGPIFDVQRLRYTGV